MTVPYSVDISAVTHEKYTQLVTELRGNIKVIDDYSLIRFNTSCSSFKYKIIEIISKIQVQQNFNFKSMICSEQTILLVISIQHLDQFLTMLKTFETEKFLSIQVVRNTKILKMFNETWSVETKHNLQKIITAYNLESDIISLEQNGNFYSILITKTISSSLLKKLTEEFVDLR